MEVWPRQHSGLIKTRIQLQITLTIGLDYLLSHGVCDAPDVHDVDSSTGPLQADKWCGLDGRNKHPFLLLIHPGYT